MVKLILKIFVSQNHVRSIEACHRTFDFCRCLRMLNYRRKVCTSCIRNYKKEGKGDQKGRHVDCLCNAVLSFITFEQ